MCVHRCAKLHVTITVYGTVTFEELLLYGSTSQLKSVFECTENMAECQSEACLLFVISQCFTQHTSWLDFTYAWFVPAERHCTVTPPPPPNPMGLLWLLVSLSASVNSLDNTLEGCHKHMYTYRQCSGRDSPQGSHGSLQAALVYVRNCMLPLLQSITSFRSKKNGEST